MTRLGALLGRTGRDITHLSSGALVAQVVMVVGQILAARLYDEAAFGYFGVVLGWANILAVVATMRYEMAIPLAATDDEARALTRLCLVSSTAVTALVGVLLALGEWAGSFQGIPGAWWGIPTILWGTAAFTTARMMAGRGGHFARIGRSGVAAAVVQVAVQLGLGVMGLVAGLTAGQGLGRIVNALNIGFGSPRGTAMSMREVAARWKRMPLLNTLPALLNVVSVGAVAPLVARWFGYSVAGQFSFATRLLAAPAVLLGQAVSQVLLPRMARIDREAGDIASDVRVAAEALILVALPVFSIVWLVGPELFSLVFDPSWRDAGVLAAVMAPWLAANFVSSPLSGYATVRDQLGRILVISLAEATARLAGLYVGVIVGDPLVGVALYSVAGFVICTVFTGWVLSLAGVRRRLLVADLVLPLALALLTGAASVWIRLSGASTATVVGVGVLGILVVSAPCGRQLMRVLAHRRR